MKKFILIFSLLITAYNAMGQSTSQNKDSISTYIVSLLEEIDTQVLKIYNENSQNRYKLYPTENIYNFLKLDTYTGIVEQVQWSLENEKEITVNINNEKLSWGSSSLFELYPTKNIYQFLLLDKSNGRTWHIQWGMESQKRWIRRIY